MALDPSGTAQQSTDGLTVTLTDTSDYSIGGNPPATNWDRTWVVRDSVGDILFTLPIPDGELAVEFSQTIDKYYEATLSFVGSPAVADVVVDFGTSQFEANMIDARLSDNCSRKCSNSGYNNLRMGFMYFNRAERAIRYTNAGTKFNKYINSSKLWLSQ